MMAYGKNGATCWLAGAVRTLQKRVEWLEARAQHAARPALVVEHILHAPAGYTAHTPVMEYISPESSVYAVPAPDVEYFSYSAQRLQCMPQLAPVVEYLAPAPAASPVVEYISRGPAVYDAPASVVEYISPAPATSPVVEYISPGPAVYAAPASVVEHIAPAPAARPVMEHFSPDPAVYVAKAPVPVTSYATAPTMFAAPAPVAEYISPDLQTYVCGASSCGGKHFSRSCRVCCCSVHHSRADGVCRSSSSRD